MVRTQQIVNQTENQKYDLPDVSVCKQRFVLIGSNNSPSGKELFEMENFWNILAIFIGENQTVN